MRSPRPNRPPRLPDAIPPAWLCDVRTADGTFVTDARQRIVAWSPAAEAIFGLGAEEAVGRPCYQIVSGAEPDGHPICRRDCRVATNARRGRPTPAYDAVARRPDGERCHLNVSILLVPGEDGEQLIMHLFRDQAAPAPARAAGARDGEVGETSRGTPVWRGAGEPVPPEPVGKPLSRREYEVLRLLAVGCTTREIAEALTISPFTARNHINNIQRRLGARNRVETLLFASHHRLI